MQCEFLDFLEKNIYMCWLTSCARDMSLNWGKKTRNWESTEEKRCKWRKEGEKKVKQEKAEGDSRDKWHKWHKLIARLFFFFCTANVFFKTENTITTNEEKLEEFTFKWPPIKWLLFQKDGKWSQKEGLKAMKEGRRRNIRTHLNTLWLDKTYNV